MSKNRHQIKAHSASRVGTAISIGPEITDQIQGPVGSSQSPSDAGFVLAYEDIQRRAYQIHVEKGGSDLENWLEAERVLKEECRPQRW